MKEKVQEIIKLAKEKYNIKDKRNRDSVFLVIHDDGSTYIQEADDYDLYGLEDYHGHIAGDEYVEGSYRAIIKLL